jgi:hypothetical protein
MEKIFFIKIKFPNGNSVSVFFKISFRILGKKKKKKFEKKKFLRKKNEFPLKN